MARKEKGTDINFGKIAYQGPRRINEVIVSVELRTLGGEETFTYKDGKQVPTGERTPEYQELSICGEIWNSRKTDCVTCGQCLDEIAKYVHTPLFKEIYELWDKYHLNGMHAGTPEQEAAVKEWMNQGNQYDYTEACKMLEKKGLLEVNFTGMTVGRVYNNEPYKYGHGWVVGILPEEVLKRVNEIIDENRKY